MLSPHGSRVLPCLVPLGRGHNQRSFRGLASDAMRLGAGEPCWPIAHQTQSFLRRAKAGPYVSVPVLCVPRGVSVTDAVAVVCSGSPGVWLTLRLPSLGLALSSIAGTR